MASHEGLDIFLKKMGPGVPGPQCRPEPEPARPGPQPRARHGHGTGTGRAVRGKSGGTAGPDSHAHTPKIATPRCGGTTPQLADHPTSIG